MASSDGVVNMEERAKMKAIVDEELKCKDEVFNVTEIIFNLMDKKHTNREMTYNWAIHQIKNNSHYISPEMKNTFKMILEKMAVAFPAITPEEKTLFDKFKAEIEPLNGDPIYYNK